METKKGKVWLVGAGTGDIGLISQKGMDVLQNAEVIVFDALVSLELLSCLPQNAEWIDAGKRSSHHLIPQEEINRILADKAKEGKNVVRLKGGDPFVFGRGGEELDLLVQEKIPFEVIPGITSSIAVPAYNGIPVTHRAYASSFHVITGHRKKDGKLDLNYEALVQLQGTLVFLMGVTALETICKGVLDAGMDPDLPAAILEKGTTCQQRRVVATVSTLKEKAEQGKISSPAVIVIGKVCALSQTFSWFEKKPLFGKQIIVTRPENRGRVLAKKLRTLGAQVIEYPTIHTTPVCQLQPSSAWEKFQKAILALEKCTGHTCLIFTSPQGVQYFFEQLKECRKDVRSILKNPQLTFGVIGRGTGEALEQYGIFADYMPKKYDAKNLGILLREQLPTDTLVYLFRAQEASSELNKELEAGNIAYREVPIYRTGYATEHALRDKVQQAITDGEIDFVTFTSVSTVKGFVRSFSNLDYSRIRAICIGEQTAAEAEKYEMKCRIAKIATMDSMVDLLLEKE